MEDKSFSKDFWSEKYQSQSTGWDIGYASPPLIEFCQTLENKDLKILIPGSGRSYEGEELWKKGFKNVFLLDMAPEAFDDFRKRVPDFPEKQMLAENFFDLTDTYDLILEQTFFCALPPSARTDYVEKMKELLIKGGELAGVLFDFPLTEQGPPFGGSKEEYEKLFSEKFEICKLERCYNSIKPREGSELFIQMKKLL
ncbi:class I SAM-dependent methyltransferase [Halocola ammonii]